MSLVFWDTNLFIYLLEDYGELTDQVDILSRRMISRGDKLFTSTMTLGEILVKPRELNDLDICLRYEDILKGAATIVPFDIEAAKHYASLRQYRGLKAPDAIQLSCAAVAEVDLFITNDNRLHTLHVPGIHFIVPLDRVPL